MQEAARKYFEFEKRSNIPIHDTKTTKLMDLLNLNTYEKGAWVLHMLRRRLGDEAFLKGESATASTEDLREAFEKASGRPLKGFFARWVYGSGHPVYRLTRGVSPIGGQLTARSSARRSFPPAQSPPSRSTSTGSVTDVQVSSDDALLKEVATP